MSTPLRSTVGAMCAISTVAVRMAVLIASGLPGGWPWMAMDGHDQTEMNVIWMAMTMKSVESL